MLATLKVKHAHLRGSALSRSLLVIDEVHASDAYMTRGSKAPPGWTFGERRIRNADVGNLGGEGTDALDR